MEKANDQFFAKNSKLSTEFSKYVLEHPEVDELLTDEAIVVFLPEFDEKLRAFNLNIAKEVESQGGQVLYVKVKEMMPSVSTRLIGVEIETREGAESRAHGAQRRRKIGMVKFRFQDLEIWQMAIEIADKLFDIADALDKKRLYRFSEQLRGAGMSMSNNISEGSGSNSAKDFSHFLNIAKRSTFENANILILLKRRNLINEDTLEGLLDRLDHLSRKITKFQRSLKSHSAESMAQNEREQSAEGRAQRAESTAHGGKREGAERRGHGEKTKNSVIFVSPWYGVTCASGGRCKYGTDVQVMFDRAIGVLYVPSIGVPR